MPHERSHRRDSKRRAPFASNIEWAIVFVGLVLSVAAGVVAYRIVGIYGDGAFTSGYHRTRDPQTGKSLLLHESRTSTGVVRRVIDGQTLKEVDLAIGDVQPARVHVEGTQITRVDRDRDGDGRTDTWEYYSPDRKILKVGFSLPADGVLDAWAYRDDSGQLVKIEVSTRRDEVIDRWEFYENGQLTRVEEDTNHDGRVDRWSTYEGGILMNTSAFPPAK